MLYEEEYCRLLTIKLLEKKRYPFKASRTLQSQVQKWLRDKHQFYISVYSCEKNTKFNYNIKMGVSDLYIAKREGNVSKDNYETANKKLP